jgi:thioesterase domain-containing protein/acyl carrier protein
MTALPLEICRTEISPPHLLETVSRIWQRVLRTADVAPESNFFDLGGDSLLAITLFLDIERETGRHLPITMIYEAQTVAEQAALLWDEPAPEFSPLVLLKTGNSDSPLFIFHGVGGSVVEFATLGRLIEIPGEVYAVQAQGIDGTQPPLESVESMARLYCDAIRAKQPSGPYWLCGYSFGGLLAIEVARLLKSAGGDIALLVMIDSYAHPITWPKKSRLKVRVRRLLDRVVEATNRPAQTFSALLSSLLRSDKSARGAVDKAARKREWLQDHRPDLPFPLLQTRLATDKALYEYEPRYYAGDVVFLKAGNPDPHFPDDPKYVWRRLVRKLEVHIGPGSHRTIINEYAPSVASRINASIRKARADLMHNEEHH